MCIHRIKEAKIKKVIFVNDKDILIEEKVDQIKFIPAIKKGVSQWFNRVRYNSIL